MVVRGAGEDVVVAAARGCPNVKVGAAVETAVAGVPNNPEDAAVAAAALELNKADAGVVDVVAGAAGVVPNRPPEDEVGAVLASVPLGAFVAVGAAPNRPAVADVMGAATVPAGAIVGAPGSTLVKPVDAVGVAVLVPKSPPPAEGAVAVETGAPNKPTDGAEEAVVAGAADPKSPPDAGAVLGPKIPPVAGATAVVGFDAGAVPKSPEPVAVVAGAGATPPKSPAEGAAAVIAGAAPKRPPLGAAGVDEAPNIPIAEVGAWLLVEVPNILLAGAGVLAAAVPPNSPDAGADPVDDPKSPLPAGAAAVVVEEVPKILPEGAEVVLVEDPNSPPVLAAVVCAVVFCPKMLVVAGAADPKSPVEGVFVVVEPKRFVEAGAAAVLVPNAPVAGTAAGAVDPPNIDVAP